MYIHPTYIEASVCVCVCRAYLWRMMDPCVTAMDAAELTHFPKCLARFLFLVCVCVCHSIPRLSTSTSIHVVNIFWLGTLPCTSASFTTFKSRPADTRERHWGKPYYFSVGLQLSHSFHSRRFLKEFRQHKKKKRSKLDRLMIPSPGMPKVQGKEGAYLGEKDSTSLLPMELR
jgi:hypothetical protein